MVGRLFGSGSWMGAGVTGRGAAHGAAGNGETVMAKMAVANASDRRQHRRVVIEAPVGIAVSRKGFGFLLWKPQFYGALKDASVGGFLCLSGRPVQAGSVVKLWLDVELDKRPQVLKMVGDVMWSRPGGAGGSHLIGVSLRERPLRTMKTWIRVMMDELRLHDGARPVSE